MKKIVVLSGAGISAESGIKTFRDEDGLWEGHDVMEVATPEGFRKNQDLVLNFYNQRRRQLMEVSPNAGHLACVELEKNHQVTIITQNVDDLHERAGSTNVVHLHGELRKVRSVGNPNEILEWKDDLFTGHLCSQGFQLRPHIVWFGEEVPLITKAAQVVAESDIVIVVGTSMQVYPAAGLVSYASQRTEIYYVDPRPNVSYELAQLPLLKIIPEKAGSGMQVVVDMIQGENNL